AQDALVERHALVPQPSHGATKTGSEPDLPGKKLGSEPIFSPAAQQPYGDRPKKWALTPISSPANRALTPSRLLLLGAQVLDDHRARALVREDLEQQAVRQRVRDHVNSAYAARERLLDRCGLRQHAVLELAFGLETREAGDVDVRDQRARIAQRLEDAGDA